MNNWLEFCKAFQVLLLIKTVLTKKIGEMKKLTFCILTAFVLFLVLPAQAVTEKETIKSSMPSSKTAELTDPAVQLARLEEIKAMDISTLSRSEKKELRNEVLAIQSSQHERGGRGYYGHGGRGFGHHRGIFISFGGILLIALLLIVLL